jgi:molybdopterin/thiamine biosynthesis adenylyltransferase
MRAVRAIWGEDMVSRVQGLRVLLVGVGGIGCEVLKCLGCLPGCEVHVLDMDTIETSNLNRQFLFQQCHNGQPKARVAA